jgi:hypothetical protein
VKAKRFPDKFKIDVAKCVERAQPKSKQSGLALKMNKSGPTSELAGQRAAIVMSVIQSAKLHEHDPWSYLKDVLTRLP